MNRNVEFKARCADLDALRQRVQALGARAAGVLRQRDTYFRCTAGRLKLREIEGDGAELIGYHRADEAKGRLCEYCRTPIPEPAVLRTLLTNSLGLRGVVEKARELWLWENVRIHLDTVERLGTFLELEAMLTDTATVADGEQLLAELVRHFDLKPADLIPVSNIDLLEGTAEGKWHED